MFCADGLTSVLMARPDSQSPTPRLAMSPDRGHTALWAGPCQSPWALSSQKRNNLLLLALSPARFPQEKYWWPGENPRQTQNTIT